MTEKTTRPLGSHVPRIYERDEHPVEFGRVLALSDGIFAFALTLLVLDIALPSATSGDLAQELVDRRAHFFAFAISLLLVGSGWWTHHRLFAMFRAVDSTAISINIAYLGAIVLIPFAQTVVARYPSDPLAYVVFASVLTAVGIVDAALFAYGRLKHLLEERVAERAVREEQLLSAVFILTFLVSIPFAFLIGPYTGLFWLSGPITQVIARRGLAALMTRPTPLK